MVQVLEIAHHYWTCPYLVCSAYPSQFLVFGSVVTVACTCHFPFPHLTKVSLEVSYCPLFMDGYVLVGNGKYWELWRWGMKLFWRLLNLSRWLVSFVGIHRDQTECECNQCNIYCKWFSQGFYNNIPTEAYHTCFTMYKTWWDMSRKWVHMIHSAPLDDHTHILLFRKKTSLHVTPLTCAECAHLDAAPLDFM